MPSILLVVFILQLFIHLVNTFGATTVNSLLWNLYNTVLNSGSKEATAQRDLKKQFVKIRTELNATSSQDEFAKWAKLRRTHDKLLEQIEKSKTESSSSRANFDRIATSLRWLGTNGLRMFLQFWCSRQPMFWIPKGWVPYYAEWLLSFPRAPLGSISIQAWGLACAAIILLVSDAVIAGVALVVGLRMKMGTTKTTKSKEKPVKVPTSMANTTEKTSAEAKKEL